MALTLVGRMQVRYQGVDWRDQSNWGCNEERNPYGQNYLDGGSLEAMEVMFVKVKQRLLDQRWAYPTNAKLYDQWYQATEEARSLPPLSLMLLPLPLLCGCLADGADG